MTIVPIQELGRRLQPGDQVVVRSGLGEGQNRYAMLHNPDYALRAVGDMMNLRGKTVTIRKAYSDYIKIKDDIWNWMDEMFEGVVIDTPADCDDDVSGWHNASICDLFD